MYCPFVFISNLLNFDMIQSEPFTVYMIKYNS